MVLRGGVALVTGAGGTVGSAVARRLAAEGMRVRGMVRRIRPDPHLDAPGIEQVQGDLLDPASLERAASGAELVVHCAAAFGPDRGLAERVNITGTESLVTAAIRGGCRRFVHISTVSVYDLQGVERVDEGTPLLREYGGVYGFTKAESERVVWRAAAAGLPVVVLRPVAVLSTHPRSTWGPLALDMLAAGQEPGRFDPFPYVHVESLAAAVVLAATSPGAVNQAYNIVDGERPAADYLGHLRRALGLPPATPSASRVRKHFIGDKARRELGHAPPDRYDEAMAELESLGSARGR